MKLEFKKFKISNKCDFIDYHVLEKEFQQTRLPKFGDDFRIVYFIWG